MRNTEIKVSEWDNTKTWSGLPAPKGWSIIERHGDGVKWQRLQGEAITVIESSRVESDGRLWLHVSVAKPNRKTPSYDDIQMLRRLFIGEDRESYMIFPTKDRYVDINPVLHLWTCLSSPSGVLPRFEGTINGNLSI
jgi:hypothetical protein